MKKNYPIGIQSFEKLITENYLYVDKTDLVYQLVKQGQIYFLSRPRRFGKSLLISTLEAYFLGKKELFKGLKIDEIEKEWIEYPVLHLDLNAEKYGTVESVYEVINRHLNNWEDLYGKDEREQSISSRFIGIIERAREKTGKKVVVLIDEYDKPMQLVMHDEKMLEEYRDIFKGFYGVLKTADPYLKFTFITGVTKFGKVSVFSDLNNTKDITMVERYSTICGITEQELIDNFDEGIHELAEKEGLSYSETCKKLKEQYDGYHFCKNGIGMYNPFSVLNTLDNHEFGDYWFATGTPTFLINMLKKGNFNMINVEHYEIFSDELSKITVDSGDPVQILYQSGYLTIKSYDKPTDLFTLGFPNQEVKNGFYKCLAPVFLEKTSSEMNVVSASIRKTLQKNDIDGFMEIMKNFLPNIPYFFHNNQKTDERHFQEIFYILLLSAGLVSRVEEYSSKGRSDIISETDVSVFVFELKMDQPVEKAMQQLEDKQYLDLYRNKKKKLFAVGVSFSSEERRITDYRIINIE